ncbi:hypothetical protein [Streptomyces sp. NRRL F-5755]|uniref:hypothetical protein n=1 Tax=Streptomyces sp. NRRL F-5755 TaxID=1519475 RepID=UPI000A40DC1D|nr:hypothetical protein [Streptomyces sp. NRRL F-5755]
MRPAGVLAYVSITTLVWHGAAPADLSPVYWIAMGAGAIAYMPIGKTADHQAGS